MSPSDYAAVQNAFTRMVVPMRREFGVVLDVPRLRSDLDYAQFIVAEALMSREHSLRECARLLDGWVQAALARRHAQARALTCVPSTVTF
jgi:hypothetical protein